MAERSPKSTPLHDRCDRSRNWQVMRILIEFTPDDVVKTAETNIKRVREYVRALSMVGIVRQLATASGRHGSCRYRLIRNLGPLAPRAGMRGVLDPNSQTHFPYPEGTTLYPSRRKAGAGDV